MTRKHLSRRTILRGIGASVALPLLDGMVPAFAAPPRIRRFGATYVGMGMNMHVWNQPAGTLEANPILGPLAAFRDHLTVVSGLDNIQALSNADAGQHPRAQSSWLTGARAKKTDGPDIHLGVSLDQIIARAFARETQLGSLELALESTEIVGNCAYGFSCAYNNTIAWRTATNPLPMENNPRNVFERLFGASDTTDPRVRLRQLQKHASILDSVTEQVGGLRTGLGARDRQKLGEYLDAVRDVERRIQKAEEQSATMELPVLEQPVGVPGTFEEHARLMFDLQLLAFQTDLTRVFTLVVAREGSTRSYPEVGVADSHHPLSHHQNNPERLARLAKLNTYHVQQFGYFLERLQATPDGEGTLFDSALLLYGSGMSDGHMHLPKNVPTLVVAGRTFGMKGNRFVQYPPESGTPLANLQLALLDKMNVPMEQFGDSSGMLAGL
ncbi:MAG: DUF1552 domain-containing protein [Acidimicrobiia bacterium]|nr:DUF1552 domain-containing protein [Acidimicrobiia bacterium]